MSVFRGRPPGRGAGISGSRMAHWASVMSVGYRGRFIFHYTQLPLLEWDRRLARWPCGSFSIRPPPNRTCKFPSLPLSSGRILKGSGGCAAITAGYDILPNHIPGISPPWLPTAPVHLPPFAIWPAVPVSDYYGDSLARGLAPRRRSRVSRVLDVRAWFRPSTHPYTRRHPSVSRPVGLRPPSVPRDGHGGVTWSQLGDGSSDQPIGIGLQAIQPWPCPAGLAGPRFADLPVSRFSGMLGSSVPFDRESAG